MSVASSQSGIESPAASSPGSVGSPRSSGEVAAAGGKSLWDVLCCRAPKSDVDTELAMDRLDSQGLPKQEGSVELERHLSEDGIPQPAETAPPEPVVEATPEPETPGLTQQESVVEGEEALAKAASATDVGGGGGFGFLQWCCKPCTNTADDELTVEPQGTGLDMVEGGAEGLGEGEAEPGADLGTDVPTDVVSGTPADITASPVAATDVSSASAAAAEPAVSLPIPPKEETKPAPAAAVEESEGKGLEEATKYQDYKARFPETSEAELRQWSQTEGCYLVLDESSNKFYAKWSRSSVPNALAFYTIHPDVQAPTRALDAGERVNLLVERGAIKKLLKAAVVGFCKQAAKYDGYFSLLNTTLWSRAGLGNLEVVWLCADESLVFCKRDTPPINLSATAPTVIGAVDNSFRLQGVSKSKRKITPRWSKSSFVNTVRSITDSSVAELDPRTKAPRKA
ncbi:hypothetical protein GNI_110650 [Gregarina niphandrodes]|uniref:Uncharacterized protein n=1 Tax=Gregarina niphandrodes TaxID=110365 RepID=A0A023B3L2_GRENI|nr:hypothetical protein GNI_110650 [Gregarina niphandrodes]EZG55609.1 hypothetical protein GNI_110650 [Gregarina niphandrodes]|eukprot:XP_011131486.1 hypothetical protein GNI_110650 [Gregarina niphandrodes]